MVSFPTDLAVSLAHKAKLHVVGSMKEVHRIEIRSDDFIAAEKFTLMLRDFQEYSLIGDFDEALSAYSKIDILTDEQKEILKKIYDHTKIYARSEVMKNLMKGLDSDPKVRVSVAELILKINSEDGIKSLSEDDTKLIIKLQ